MSPLLVVPSRMLTTARASLYLATAGAALAFGVTTSDFLLFGGGGAMLPGVVGADGLGVTGDTVGTVSPGGTFAFAFAIFLASPALLLTGREVDPNKSK